MADHAAVAIVVLSLLVLLPVAVLTYVWNSCVWTLFWSRTAGAARRKATMDDDPLCVN